MPREIDFDINHAVRVNGLSLALLPPSLRDLIAPENTEPREVGSLTIEAVMHVPCEINGVPIGTVQTLGQSVLFIQMPQLAQIYAALDRLCELYPAFAEDFRAEVARMKATMDDRTLMAHDMTEEVDDALSQCLVLRPATADSGLAACDLPTGHDGDHQAEGAGTWPR